jgi:hypothetical protein
MATPSEKELEFAGRLGLLEHLFHVVLLNEFSRQQHPLETAREFRKLLRAKLAKQSVTVGQDPAVAFRVQANLLREFGKWFDGLERDVARASARGADE